MRVLLSGASGFLGRALAAALQAANHEVLSIGRSTAVLIRNLNADLRDPASVAAVTVGHAFDTVIHGAAVATLDVPDPASAYQTNVLMTVNLRRAAEQVGARRFIFLSSQMVYGDHYRIGHRNFTLAAPSNWYGRSKQVSELIVEQARPAVASLSVRLPSVLGPGKTSSDMVRSFAHQAREFGQIQVFGDGSATRQFLDIRDLCMAMEELVGANLADLPPCVPLCAPETVSIGSVAHIVAAAVGHVKVWLEGGANPPGKWIDPDLIRRFFPFRFRTVEESIRWELGGEARHS